MKRYAKTMGIGLVIGLVLVGLYELAGGDATIVVMLVMLAALVKIRLDELRETLEAMRAATPDEQCGDTIGGWDDGIQQRICTLAHGHRSEWHSDQPGVRDPHQWKHHP